MWTGRIFLIKEPVFAIESAAGERIARNIPLGQVVEVIAGPTPNANLVQVRWGNLDLHVFASDLQTRGEEIRRTAAD
jgi:hypothetical protein